MGPCPNSFQVSNFCSISMAKAQTQVVYTMRQPAKVGLPVVLLLWLVGCAINPATGKRQFSLMSEGQEIQMGQEADPEIVASMGLYPDESLQAYVQELGSSLAASSERPDLPWTPVPQLTVRDELPFRGPPDVTHRPPE